MVARRDVMFTTTLLAYSVTIGTLITNHYSYPKTPKPLLISINAKLNKNKNDGFSLAAGNSNSTCGHISFKPAEN